MSSYNHHLLPEEIISETLLKLPTKSLIRFKSVCNQWLNLINNPQFMSKHLLPAHDNGNLLLVKRRDNVSHDHVFSLLSGPNLDRRSQYRPLPYPEIDAEIEIMGPCNGLFCLCYTDGVTCHRVVLWRPENGELKILPPSDVPNPPEFSPEVVMVMPKHGFGYDCEVGDYKEIRMSILEEDHFVFGHKIEVYSFKSDSWKGIVSFRIDYIEYRYAVNVCGICLWWAKDRILWFLMSDESFGTIMPPTDMDNIAFRYDHLGEALDNDYYGDGNNDPSWYKKLFVLNDKNLALVVYDRRQRVCKCFHVWVLLEFGIHESWFRLFTIGPLVEIQRPIQFWENGKMIMENTDGKFISCDPFANEIKSLDIFGIPKSLQIVSVKAKYVLY